MDKVDLYCACQWRQSHILRTIKSLILQPEFGTLTLVCNNMTIDQYKFIVDQLFAHYTDKVINTYFGDNLKQSNEKLKYVHEGSNKYIMLFDDDLIYPQDYLSYLIQGCEKYNAYVGLHGVILNKEVYSYYRDRIVFRGLGEVQEDQQVDIASNCGSLFKREWFSDLSEWYDRCSEISMDDIYTNYWASKAGIKRYVLKHQLGYIKHKQQYFEDNYVFDRYKYDDKFQTEFINTYWLNN